MKWASNLYILPHYFPERTKALANLFIHFLLKVNNRESPINKTEKAEFSKQA